MKFFAEHGDRVAAVIIEGIPAINGLLIQRHDYVQLIRALTRSAAQPAAGQAAAAAVPAQPQARPPAQPQAVRPAASGRPQPTR